MHRLFLTAAAALGLVSAAWAQEITPPPPAPSGAAPESLLPALIQHSRHSATMIDGRLAGEGADFLRELGRNAHFVLIGEDHGYAGIAEFAAAYWRDLNTVGYQYAALEIDPYVAADLERTLRAGGVAEWARYLAGRGGAMGAPFMAWAPEAALAEGIVRSSRTRREPAIWGLDQVFIGAAPWLLRDIADSARSREARTLAAALADEGAASDDRAWFGKIDGARLQALRAALAGRADARWAERVDAMIVSHRIYQPFTSGHGEAYLANDERETQMKRLFQAHYEAAMRADREAPRVMLKFGSYHMMRGATPTHVQGLGGFVTEFAVARGQRAVSILAMCGPGGAVAQHEEAPLACDGLFTGPFSFLAAHVSRDEIAIFDLRVWRLRPGRWAHLPAEMRQLIDSYDVAVVIPGRPAAAALAGLDG